MLSPTFDAVVEGSGRSSVGEKEDSPKVAKSDTNDAMNEKRTLKEHGTMSCNHKEKHVVQKDDVDLIALAKEHYNEDRLLAAARVLRVIKNKALLKPHHMDILSKARLCESLVEDLKSPVSDGWTKQGESHGQWDSVIYFKMDPETNTKLTARVETPIEPSLLVPLLSVLNETELYPTWLPSWKKPFRLGVTKAEKLRQTGRASQVILLAADMPWPLSPREAVVSALALDDIQANGDICVKLHSLAQGEDGIVIPPPVNGAVRTRVDFEGGFLFRKCPSNHAAFRHQATARKRRTDMILVCFSAYVDAKVQFLPQAVINFIVRTVIGRMWNKFLLVAEHVKDGKRSEHLAAIAKKRKVLYDWVDDRVRAMFEQHMVMDASAVACNGAIDDHPENWF